MDMQDAIEEISMAINALTAEMRGIREQLTETQEKSEGIHESQIRTTKGFEWESN
jgi:hypothetical protein